MIRLLVNIVFFITHPSYWFMNARYSPEWDRVLNELMEEYEFEDTGEHYTKLGGVSIWIANHPYASFTPTGGREYRPARTTIYEARRKLMRECPVATRLRLKRHYGTIKTGAACGRDGWFVTEEWDRVECRMCLSRKKPELVHTESSSELLKQPQQPTDHPGTLTLDDLQSDL